MLSRFGWNDSCVPLSGPVSLLRLIMLFDFWILIEVTPMTGYCLASTPGLISFVDGSI